MGKGLEVFCHDNARLVLKNYSNCAITMWDYSIISVIGSSCSVFVCNNAILTVSYNSTIETIVVFAMNSLTYSWSIYDSIVNKIFTYGWG